MAYLPDKKGDYNIDNIDAMLASQYVGLKVVNGYTGNCPDYYYDFLVNNNLPALKGWFEYKKIPLDTTKRVLIIR